MAAMADDAAGSTFDDVADALYALDPDEFVSARDRAAKQLRSDGDADAARAVKALRRPTVVAWAVNQLPRLHRAELDEFLETTEAVAAAQRKALAGRGDDLRPVGERRQRQLDDLVARAEAVVTTSGRSAAAHGDDIARTLQASSDPTNAERLREGRLVTALEAGSALEGLASWFEESGEMTAATTRARRRSLEQATREADDALQAAAAELHGAEAEVERLQGQLRDAKRRVDRLRSRRDQLARELEDARGAID
jgi:chromosome segregation ATPase